MNDPTFGGLVPTRLGYTITPKYSGATKDGREARRAAHDAAHKKGLRLPYFQFRHKDERSKAKALADAMSAAIKFNQETGYLWVATECMF